MRGYIYVLNSFEKGVYKIGMTTRTVTQRVQEINSATGIYKPLDVVFSVEVENAAKVEKEIHQLFSHNRINKNREFFRVPISYIEKALQRYSLQSSKTWRTSENYDKDLRVRQKNEERLKRAHALRKSNLNNEITQKSVLDEETRQSFFLEIDRKNQIRLEKERYRETQRSLRSTSDKSAMEVRLQRRLEKANKR